MKPAFGDSAIRDSTSEPVLVRHWFSPGSSPASAPAPSRAVTYFSLRASGHPPTEVGKTDASRLSLGRTPPGACLENTNPSAFFSRCQLPRPNCQGTKQAARMRQYAVRTARVLSWTEVHSGRRRQTLPQPTETGLNPRQRLPRAAWREPILSTLGSAARLMEN